MLETLYKTTSTAKQHIREIFLYRPSLAAEQLLGDIKDGNFVGYLQCYIDIPEKMRSNFANFPESFKNTLVSKIDIGDLMTSICRKKNFSEPRKMLISSFTLQNRTYTTPLLLFYLQLGFVWTKLNRFVEYTSKICFSSFVQSAVDAWRQGDEILNSSVAAEAMKLLANSSYGYQIMDRSQHTVTKYLSDEKTHKCRYHW